MFIDKLKRLAAFGQMHASDNVYSQKTSAVVLVWWSMADPHASPVQRTCCMTGRNTSLYFRCLIIGTASWPWSVGNRTSGGCGHSQRISSAVNPRRHRACLITDTNCCSQTEFQAAAITSDDEHLPRRPFVGPCSWRQAAAAAAAMT